MSLTRRTILALSLSSPLIVGVAGAAAPIRIGLLRFGAASWEIDVIRRNGFDAAHGIAIDPVELAASQAAQVALQAGRVDMIFSDFLWVANQRTAGADWTFAPFSTAVGALIAPDDSPVKSVADLKGARLGIAGSPLDKSWLILRAYGMRKLGVDFDQTAQKSFGAPPLLSQQLAAGQLDAVLTFWPFAAKAEAAGMRRIMGVEDMTRALGVAADPPFVGYVFSAGWADRNRDAVAGFLAAGRDAQALLAQSDAEWEKLKPLTGAADDAEFIALRNAYRAGIPAASAASGREAAAALYAILAEIGGAALVGAAPTLPPGTFWQA